MCSELSTPTNKCYKYIIITMVLVCFSRQEFALLGLKLAGFNVQTNECTCDSTNHERFKDKFYASPKTVNNIFHYIQSPDLGDAQIANPRLSVPLYFLKQYPTKHGLASFLDSTEKTGLGWVWRYIIVIQAL
jgi:hypothetical protein